MRTSFNMRPTALSHFRTTMSDDQRGERRTDEGHACERDQNPDACDGAALRGDGEIVQQDQMAARCAVSDRKGADGALAVVARKGRERLGLGPAELRAPESLRKRRALIEKTARGIAKSHCNQPFIKGKPVKQTDNLRPRLIGKQDREFVAHRIEDQFRTKLGILAFPLFNERAGERRDRRNRGCGYQKRCCAVSKNRSHGSPPYGRPRIMGWRRHFQRNCSRTNT